MGPSETPTKDQSSSDAITVDIAEAGGVTVWDHARTFALVGVSLKWLSFLV